MSREQRNPVARLSSLPLEPFRHGQAYESEDARIGDRLGLTKIGATYIEVPPGKSSCPCHVHHVWDELFVILEGHGRYRFGEEAY